MSSSKEQLVLELFRGTGETYDAIVERATRGEDRRWKETMLARLGRPRRVLDLACGTGILTFMILDRFPECQVVGVDIQQEYLDVAIERARQRRDTRVEFVLSPAEEVGLSQQFDAVTACYLPKYADLPRLVPRLAERLEPGGLLLMQDFAYPREPAVLPAWERRFAELESWARDNLPEAVLMFRWLPDIIRQSNWIDELVRLMKIHGFWDVGVQRLSWGTCAIVSGKNPDGSRRSDPKQAETL